MYRYTKIGRPLLGPWLKACIERPVIFISMVQIDHTAVGLDQ
jgi:hypothetical protein